MKFHEGFIMILKVAISTDLKLHVNIIRSDNLSINLHARLR